MLMASMASIRDPYAGVGMLAATQLAQLNHLMMQQQALEAQQPPRSPPQMPLPGMPLPRPGSPNTPPECQSPPISRTYTYKKVTKPLLERKRRARINRCLDELKELLVGALEAEGENVSKLEKADILELTVRHLQRMNKPRDAAEDASRFQAGFSQCASEACHFLLGLPGLDAGVGRRLVAHLSQVVTGLGAGLPRPTTAYSPPASPDPDILQPRQAPAPGQQAAPLSPSACPEVSSTSWNISGGPGAPRPAKRSLERHEDSEDDADDVDDADSDVPVNYTSEALSRQCAQQRKRLRVDNEADDQADAHCSSSVASPSQMGSQCGSDADDEDKGPMWRPW